MHDYLTTFLLIVLRFFISHFLLIFNMEQELIQNKDDFPDTHFFVYKDKRYPIKYHFFKFSSKYFFNNSSIIKKTQDIPLVEEESENKISLSEQSIIDFIKYVQHEPIYLTNENISEIDFLAKKFEVSSLTELIKKYMSSHNDELAIQFLIIYSNDPTISTDEYEEIISEHFLEYIQDKRLFDIQLPILYRIFTKYQEMNGNEELNNQNIVDFLFKCLDKYGRQASVLFTNVDFRFLQYNCLDSLLTKYSKIFDFSYINFAFLKSLYEQQNEIIRKEIENSKKIDEFQNQMKQEFEKIKSDHKKDLESQKQTEYENIKNIKNEMSKMKNELEQQLTEQKDKYEKEIITLKKEIKEQISKQIDEKKKTRQNINF